MRKTLTALVAAASVFALPASAKTDPFKGEAQLAKLLDGRVAGEPRSCIHLPHSGTLQIINRTALVYKQGSTIYVNRTADPRTLNSNNILVIDRFSSQLCRTDMVQMRSQGGRFSYFAGAVFLEDFVPYRKSEG